MKRAELKEVLSQPTAESRRLYRMYPDLYYYLVVWEDYLNELAFSRKRKFKAPRNRARYTIMVAYHIGENTFYKIRSTLAFLCSDMEDR